MAVTRDEEKDDVTVSEIPLGLYSITLVKSVTQNQFRQCFGSEECDKSGYFVSECMSAIIFDYHDWVEYPKGETVISENNGVVMDLAITEDGRYLYASAKEGFILCIDLSRYNQNLNIVGHWRGHPTRVRGFDMHGSMLASCSDDPRICVWDTQPSLMSFQKKWDLDGHFKEVCSVRFLNDANELVSASRDKSLRLFSLRNGQCLRVFIGHSKFVKSLCIIEDDNDRSHQKDDVISISKTRSFLSGSTDKTIKLWNTDESKCVDTFDDFGMVGVIKALDMNSDRSLIAAATMKCGLIFQWPSMEMFERIEERMTALAFHPISPHILATAVRRPDRIQIMDLNQGTCLCEFDPHSRMIKCLVFTPDGTRLISGSRLQTIVMSDLSDLL